MIHVSVKITTRDKIIVDLVKHFSKENDSIRFCKRVYEISKYLRERCIRIGLEETCYTTSIDSYVSKIATGKIKAMVGDLVSYNGREYEVVNINKDHFYKNHPTETKLNAFGKPVPVIIDIGTYYSGIIKRNTVTKKVNFSDCIILKRKYPDLWKKEDMRDEKES